MKILVIECGAHEQIIDRFLPVFTEFGNKVQILGLKSREDWFHSSVRNQVELILERRLLFWIKAMTLSKKVEKVFIFTGPEYTELKANLFYFFNLFYFLTFIIFVKKNRYKLTLRLVNTHFWYQTATLASAIRNYTLKRYLENKKAFEYKQIAKNVIRDNENYAALSGSVWMDNPFQFENQMTIAFSGQVNAHARDLSVLAQAIKMIERNERVKLNFNVCSPPSDQDRAWINQQLSSLAKVTFYNDRDRYVENIRKCSLLIAPLSKKLGYGNTKGTGAFGDALYVNRKVLIPRFACLDNEFDGVAHYYESVKDLANLLVSSIDAWKSKNKEFFTIDSDAQKNFSAYNIYDQYLKFVL